MCSTDMLVELSRREKIAGIKPDEDLDILMKVHLVLMKALVLALEIIAFELILFHTAITLPSFSKGVSFGRSRPYPRCGVHFKGNSRFSLLLNVYWTLGLSFSELAYRTIQFINDPRILNFGC